MFPTLLLGSISCRASTALAEAMSWFLEISATICGERRPIPADIHGDMAAILISLKVSQYSTFPLYLSPTVFTYLKKQSMVLASVHEPQALDKPIGVS